MKIEDKEHRRLRLRELVDHRLKHEGMTKARFAVLADIQPAYLGRLLSEPSKKQHRSIDLAVMMKIIEGHNLSYDWFNLPLGSELDPAEDRQQRLASVYGMSPMAITMAGYFQARVPNDSLAQNEAFQVAQEAITVWLEKRKPAQNAAPASARPLRKSRALRRAQP